MGLSARSEIGFFLVALVTLVFLALPRPLHAQQTPEARSTDPPTSELSAPLTIAVPVGYPPFSVRGPDGEAAGLLVDLWHAWSEASGQPVRFLLADWSGTLAAMREGDADIHSGLYRTPDREEWLGFTKPIHRIRSMLFYRASDPARGRTLAALTGRRVGSLRDTYHAQRLAEEDPGIVRVLYQETGPMMRDLVSGRLDAVFHEEPTVFAVMDAMGLRGAVVAGNEVLADRTLFGGVAKDRPDLLARIDRGLDAIPADILTDIDVRWLPNPEARYHTDTALARGLDGGAASGPSPPDEVVPVAQRLDLTEEEDAWIRAHSEIKVGVMADWPPFSFLDADGQSQGISRDVISALAGMVGLKVTFVPGPWDTLLASLKDGELDVLMDATPKPERRPFMHFSAPYLAIPHVIIAAEERTGLHDETALAGLTVALERGFGNVEWFRRNHPDVTVREYPDTSAALDAVARGEADAYVGNRTVARYLMVRDVLPGLAIHGRLTREPTRLAVAVPKDRPELAAILDKGLDALGAAGIQAILARWVHVGIPVEGRAATTAAPASQSPPPPAPDIVVPDTPLDLGKLAFWVGAVLALLAGLAGWLVRSGRIDSLASEMGSARLRGLMVGGLCLVILGVGTVVWLAYQHNRARILDIVGTNLQTVLTSTVERLDLWIQDQKRLTANLGRDPTVVAEVRQLLSLPRDRINRDAAMALSSIKSRLDADPRRSHTADFTILALDGTVIGSTEATDLSLEAAIIEQYPDLIARAVAGEAIMTPPMRGGSGRPAGSPSERDNRAKPMIVFAAPVQDAYGTRYGLIAQRRDALGDFSAILETGRIGHSGETYAFNSDAVMVSRSRFEEELVDLGMLAADQTAVLGIPLRVPMERHDPRDRGGGEIGALTRMAESALAGHPGVDLSGYLDYRGELVLGAWTFDHEAGLGIATEIHAEEALGPARTLGTTLGGILVLTLALTTGATSLTLILGERTSRILTRAKDELEDRVVERTRELAEASDRLRLALDNMSNGLCVLDREFRFVMSNDIYLEMLSLPEGMVVPGAPSEAVVRFLAERGDYGPVDDIEAFMRARREMWRSGGTTALEIRPPNGRVLHVHTRATDDGSTVVALTDITEIKRKEEALAWSRSMLESLFDSIPDMIYAKDAEGFYLHANRSFERYVGMSAVDMVGATDEEILPAEIAESRRAKDAQMLAQGMAFRSEEWIDFPDDGKPVLLDTLTTPFFAQDGTPLGLLSISRDITARKEAEDKLAQAEEQNRLILGSVNDGIFGTDAEGRLIFINDRALELLGYERGALDGQALHHLLHHSRADGSPYPPEECPMLAAYSHGKSARVDDEVLWRRDGSRFPVEYSTAPMWRDGAIFGAVIAFRDITERKETERRIRESEQKIRRIFETASEGIWMLDLNYRVTEVNDAIRVMLDRPEEDIRGRPLFDFVHDGHRDDLAVQLAKSGQARADLYEIALTRPDGTLVHCLCNATPMLDDEGRTVGSFGMLTDITERKQAEQALTDAYDVITGSIEYASRIQRSMLPDQELLNTLVPEHFVIWEPRDRVGGDAYWCQRWGRGAMLALGDCTGHGVPGAFMTMIANGALDMALLETPPGEPAVLLARVHALIQSMLGQDREGGESNDGLDLGICYLPSRGGAVVFAGAKISLFRSVGGLVTEVRGDKFGLGYRGTPTLLHFNNHRIEPVPGQILYMTSDGLIDQVGGPRRRGFGKRRFTGVLQDAAERPLSAQRDAIVRALAEHQGDEDRRDDVSVLGFRTSRPEG
ncbi:PAS domain S-box protein [Rhodospira trueperi]|uniref:PAS domain S-box-containing protein n=1 Tax=Rhodospira trueperi TaxID=69960 RepID=A0A1G7EGQ0_9PROT|nr:transporter substrate-binding domain-containing protein [Rhodospira trueperi]SDE62625.1 PAS domain S-box-containing protein [Rhodospira trueperi]